MAVSQMARRAAAAVARRGGARRPAGAHQQTGEPTMPSSIHRASHAGHSASRLLQSCPRYRMNSSTASLRSHEWMCPFLMGPWCFVVTLINRAQYSSANL